MPCSRHLRDALLALLVVAVALLVSCSSPAPPVPPPRPPPPLPAPAFAPPPLAAKTGGPKPVETPAAVPEPPAPVEAPRPAPLPRGTVVLHVGDSMADALGKSLKIELEKRGIKNVLKAKEATYIPQWAGFTMGFAALVVNHNPDLVIITLGGNEVAMPDPTVRAEPVRKMVQTVGDRPCLWIAAPLWPGAPHSGILDVIRKNCAPCIYVDTNVLIPDLERLGDRVHPTIRERHRWAKFMIRWMEHNLDPAGRRKWDFRTELLAPPAEVDYVPPIYPTP